MGNWKASDQHQGKKADDRAAGWEVGTEHKDIYHTDESGKRDSPHHTDMKISYDSTKPDTSDIKK